MNREILFRGKRVDNGEWVYGLFCECPCDDGTDIPSIMKIESKGNYRAFMQYPIISETRGQYTGLTDKNGRRIFEGDIVKYKDKIYEIRYFTTNARFLAILPNGMFNPAVFLNCEVIDNIHDISELLGGD